LVADRGFDLDGGFALLVTIAVSMWIVATGWRYHAGKGWFFRRSAFRRHGVARVQVPRQADGDDRVLQYL
jgi:hypothetical protein